MVVVLVLTMGVFECVTPSSLKKSVEVVERTEGQMAFSGDLEYFAKISFMVSHSSNFRLMLPSLFGDFYPSWIESTDLRLIIILSRGLEASHGRLILAQRGCLCPICPAKRPNGCSVCQKTSSTV